MPTEASALDFTLSCDDAQRRDAPRLRDRHLVVGVVVGEVAQLENVSCDMCMCMCLVGGAVLPFFALRSSLLATVEALENHSEVHGRFVALFAASAVAGGAREPVGRRQPHRHLPVGLVSRGASRLKIASSLAIVCSKTRSHNTLGTRGWRALAPALTVTRKTQIRNAHGGDTRLPSVELLAALVAVRAR